MLEILMCSLIEIISILHTARVKRHHARQEAIRQHSIKTTRQHRAKRQKTIHSGHK